MPDTTDLLKRFEQKITAVLDKAVATSIRGEVCHVRAAIGLKGFADGGSVSAFAAMIETIAHEFGLIVTNEHYTYKEEYDDFSAEVICRNQLI